MCKNFKFILEIKFSSSKQFNNVVTEHSILNEKEVTFVRHDAKKVKMECTLKCNFQGICSRDKESCTYTIKIIHPKYKCGRMFANKNGKTIWV